MNVRKSVDYNALFAALESLMAVSLPQMELYCEIGSLVGTRPEKGAAAAEHPNKTYTNAAGFSPRNLRRMREFYQAYAVSLEVVKQAMEIGWTQNVVILESCQTPEERLWYIQAVRQYNWTKAELTRQIHDRAYQKSVLAPTSQNINLLANLSRLNHQEMVYCEKQPLQSGQKEITDYRATIIQDQRSDRSCTAYPVRERPRLVETRLMPAVGYIPPQYGIRPRLLLFSLRRTGNPTIVFSPRDFQMNTSFSKAFLLNEAGHKYGIEGNNFYIDQFFFEYIDGIIFDKKQILWSETNNDIDYKVYAAPEGYRYVQFRFRISKGVAVDYKGWKTKVHRINSFFR